jgi:mitochondrial enoyl-[acyl-carrier protein] reductase / trans-2-enoyl-CoA reductase
MLVKSIIFKDFGPLHKSLLIHKHSLPPSPSLIKILIAPINPSDINIIEGSYPLKPIQHSFGYIPGQEGLGVMMAGRDEGKFILPLDQSFNTWQTHCLGNGIVLEDCDKVPERFLATISVNPSTAFKLLKGFGDLKVGDCVILNCGTSGVARSLIQLSKAWGIKTIVTVRRPQDEDIFKNLYKLGAGLVMFDDEIIQRRVDIESFGKPKVGYNGVPLIPLNSRLVERQLLIWLEF